MRFQTIMNEFSKKSVLVTGASSGIGNAIAVYLAKQGYIVLATVRKNSDVESLNKLGLDNLKPLCPLDLTKQDQILLMANSIKERIQNKELPSLYAIINVAGGGQIAPIELMGISNFRDELEKRLVGPVDGEKRMNSKGAMKLLFIVFLLVTLPFAGTPKEVQIAAQAAMIVKTAEKYHYSPRPVNDDFSKAVYESFLHMLDPYGLIFTEEAVGRLDGFKFALADEIHRQKTAFIDAAALVYVKQLQYVDSLLREMKNKDIDLAAHDTLWLGGDPTYGKQSSLKKKWEQWIKYMVLWAYQNNKDSTKAEVVTSQKETHKILGDVLSRETCRIQLKMNPPGGMNGLIGLRYLKAIASAFDPHTAYMSSAEKNLFEADLSKESGSFGIRVNFNAIGEIEIVGVMPGGPAWKSNKINEGDVILDIKKSDGGALDPRCATLSDVYGFLSSIGNNQAGFRVRKKNGKIMTVSLKKELLDVEENTIRSYILKGDALVGYVYLPSFYTDFSYGNYFSKGCANDMAKELIKLKGAAINGLILDIRSNGGGSLEEACRMAGIFIDYGALCITHSRGKEPEIIKDNARGVVYGGPLIVLTNSSSASASELFAGVLQDYNRALIVGSKTFGKSTFQEIVPVDAGNFDSLPLYKGDPPGYVTLTMGAIYRVTGTSHQKTGVTPDLELPQVFEDAMEREASNGGALDLGKISKKTYYYPVNPLPAGALRNLSGARLKGSAAFRYIRKTGALAPALNRRHPVPLDFQSFVKYINRFNELEDSLIVKNGAFTADAPDYDKSKGALTDLDKADDENNVRAIRGDAYINEAFAIMQDLITMTTNKEGK